MTVRKGRRRLAAAALAFSSTSSSIDRVVRMRESPGPNKIGGHHSIIDNDVKTSFNQCAHHLAPQMQKLNREERELITRRPQVQILPATNSQIHTVLINT